MAFDEGRGSNEAPWRQFLLASNPEMTIAEIIRESKDPDLIFDEYFSEDSLKKVFIDKYSRASSKGLDRLSGQEFKNRNYEEVLRVASSKCRHGTYRFSPYLEVLKIKKRDKFPRVISLPSIRDRVVLYQLNKYLATECFSSDVIGGFARQHISRIVDDLGGEGCLEGIYIYRTDIKSFYDSVCWHELLKILPRHISCERAVRLVLHAIMTPTIPVGTRRSEYKSYRPRKGIPQGLSISNILASIYMKGVDGEMEKLGVGYYRYVDDVFVYGEKQGVERARQKFEKMLSDIGLNLYSDGSEKSSFQKAVDAFEYLGYRFSLPALVSVRESSKERFLRSVVAMFSDYTRHKERRLREYSYLNEERVRNIFLLELNDKITGAISSNRLYGWIPYYYKINDMKLLCDIDRVVERLFKRLPDFGGKPPKGLKKVRRAYFEVKYSAQRGYIRNYDKVNSREGRLKFLVERGLIGPLEELTDEQIDSRFESYVKGRLQHMSRDEGGVY